MGVLKGNWRNSEGRTGKRKLIFSKVVRGGFERKKEGFLKGIWKGVEGKVERF